MEINNKNTKIDHYKLTLFFGTFFYPGWKLVDIFFLQVNEPWFFRMIPLLFGIAIFAGLKYSKTVKKHMEYFSLFMSFAVTGEYLYLIYWAFCKDSFTFTLYLTGSFIILGCFIFQWRSFLNLFSYVAFSSIGLGILFYSILNSSLVSNDYKLSIHFLILYSLLFIISGSMSFSWIKSSIKADKLRLENEKNKAYLLHTSKLAHISEMAGGIAHELNNPLQSITFALEMIKSEFPDVEKHYSMQEIDQQTFRMKSIIDSLLKMKSENTVFSKEPCNLKDIIDQNLRLYTEKFKSHYIKLELHLSDIFVEADIAEISQMFHQLIANAFDSVSKIAEDKREISIIIENKNNKALVRIVDSGDKIDPAIQSKIFNPFFTTKQGAELTGLSGMGLSVTKTILEKHSGHIYYQDEPKEFVVELPLLHQMEKVA